MAKHLLPDALIKILTGTDEFTLMDVREQGEFSRGHLLMACCVPLSRMELVINDLIPRYTTHIVLVDDGPSDPFQRAQRALGRLSEFGYTNVSILEGGVDGWRKSGYSLFSGINVVSKAFGEFVESSYDTPHLTPKALHEKLTRGEKLVIFDARPEEEYHRMNIPGAVNVPGSELVYRFFDRVPDRDTLVVVNCAGRTRSIIGAQSLINARVPNPVSALKNGTMGWHLAGLDLEYGRQGVPSSPPSSEGLARATACAKQVAERFGVKKINLAALSGWQKERANRTLYILDVRLPEEYEAGHLKGSRNAPGVQLIQATDEYMPVRNARVVLVDDCEIRAAMTASWLIQMGWRDVFVLDGGIGEENLVSGAFVPHIPGFRKMKVIPPRELKEQLELKNAIAVIDVATSRDYRKAHIPATHWAIRSRLASDLSKIPKPDKFVVTSPDGILAHLAAEDIKAAQSDVPVEVLLGGTAAWVEAGYITETGMTAPISIVEDVLYKPYESNSETEKAMKAYLDWEVALVEAVEKDGTLKFQRFD